MKKDKTKAKQKKKLSKEAVRHSFWKIFLTVVGSLIYAAGIGFFLEPLHLSAGGVAGIGLLLDQVVPIGTGMWTLILNIPVLLLGLRKFGFRFLGLTVLALLISSPLIDVFAALSGGITQDPLLAALAGGALMGAGMGLLFRAGASSGGADIVTKVLHLHFRHIKSGVIFMTMDVVIVMASMLVFRNIDIGLYAALGILVSSYLMNTVLYGTDEARMVFIVSDRADELADILLKKLDLGATVLNGYGAYTGNEKRVLLCVMRPKQLPYARELVADGDQNAFMVVAGASSVFGEGFKSYSAEDL